MSVRALQLVPGFENLDPSELGALLKLPEKDLIDLADPSLTPEQQLRIIRGYREAEAEADVSGWSVFMKVVGVVGTVAGVILPVASAVQGILGVVSAAKAAAAKPSTPST